MTFGAKVVATLRALGLFAGVWGVLALVAWIGGVVPSRADGAVPDEEDAHSASTDDESAENDAGGEGEDPEPPVPVEPVEVAPDTPSVALASPLATSAMVRVCSHPLAPVSMAVGQIVGDDTEELVVSCGADLLILGRAGAGVMRVGEVRDAGSTPARAASVALGDLDGDGRQDLLVGFIGAAESAAASRLIVVPGNERGGLDSATVLAPISAVEIMVAELDGRPGIDIVALHQADGFGRRPSEAWVIAGGPSPVRTHRQVLRTGARALVLGDVNGDQNIDVLGVGEDQIRAYTGDGAGRLGRAADFSERGAEHMVGSVSDGQAYVAFVTGGQLWVRRNADAPAVVLDLQGDVRGLASGVSGEELFVLHPQAWVRVALGDGHEEVRTPLPAGLDALDFTPWGDEIVVLGRSEEGIELIRLPLSGGGEVDEGSEPGLLMDAPLVLRVDVR